MIREHRGSLKVEERLDGAVWVLRFKTTRGHDHKRVERTRVVGRVQDFPTEGQAFAEAERLRLYTIQPGSKRGTLTFAILAEFYLQETAGTPGGPPLPEAYRYLGGFVGFDPLPMILNCVRDPQQLQPTMDRMQAMAEAAAQKKK